MSNVKVGDLCYVKPPRSGGFCDLTGHVVTVIERCTERMQYPDVQGRTVVGLHWDATDQPLWLIKTDRVSHLSDGTPTKCARMWEHRLRPIRNPGDVATDESAAWLPPVPSTKREPEAA